MDFPVLLDATADLMTQQFGLNDTVPATIFLDVQGNVVVKIEGQVRKKDLLSRIERLLSNQDNAQPKAASEPTPQKIPPASAAP
jgi:hypothetical protein